VGGPQKTSCCFLAPGVNRTTIPRTSIPYPSHYTNCDLPALFNRTDKSDNAKTTEYQKSNHNCQENCGLEENGSKITVTEDVLH
jgi:hypothetical protein